MASFLRIFLIYFLIAGAANAADDWTRQSPSSYPSARNYHAMSYIGGDQVVLFGGWDSTFNGETWVYDLSEGAWTQQSPSSHPSARWGHATAYIGGDREILFGGHDSSYRDETWVYDLSADTWTQQSPSSYPSPRFHHAMAYIGGDQVVLFGGLEGAVFNDETWMYDLSADTWTQQSPSSHPSARAYHAMAYIGEDQVVLFGGYDVWHDNETWVYDLSADAWTQQSPSSHPSARNAHAMAYIGGDQVVLFGGYDGWLDDETWVYDLSADTWAQDANTTQPSARFGHALSETSMDGSSYPILFGGNDDYFNDETWTFGGGDYLVSLDAMVLDIELIGANTARISWSAIAGATDYDLYRSTTAFFNGSDPPWQTVAAPTTQLDFSDGVGDPNTNYYVLGKARNATQTSAESNVVGEFDLVTEDGQ